MHCDSGAYNICLPSSDKHVGIYILVIFLFYSLKIFTMVYQIFCLVFLYEWEPGTCSQILHSSSFSLCFVCLTLEAICPSIFRVFVRKLGADNNKTENKCEKFESEIFGFWTKLLDRALRICMYLWPHHCNSGSLYSSRWSCWEEYNHITENRTRASWSNDKTNIIQHGCTKWKSSV